MSDTLVMTLLAADRPGLVESVAAVVAEHGGNWLESRMSHLGGQFAGILRVAVAPNRKDSLLAALRTLGSSSLAITVHPDESPITQVRDNLYFLELTGHDRPGIVREISAALAAEHVNVEEFESEISSAAMTGETLFTARATLQLPASCDTLRVRQRLEKIASDLIVDITLAPLQVAK